MRRSMMSGGVSAGASLRSRLYNRWVKIEVNRPVEPLTKILKHKVKFFCLKGGVRG